LVVAGTAGTIEGMDLVKKVGADHVFNHREKGYLNNAVAAIGGHGFNVVLENLANVNLGADLTVLNQQARVAVSYITLLQFALSLHRRGTPAVLF
jgi:NADPH2:quinone reductase